MKKIQFSERTNSSVRIFLGEDDYTDYGFFVSYEDVNDLFGKEFGAEVMSNNKDITVFPIAENDTVFQRRIDKIKERGINPFYKNSK
jgi:hypothetical protein